MESGEGPVIRPSKRTLIGGFIKDVHAALSRTQDTSADDPEFHGQTAAQLLSKDLQETVRAKIARHLGMRRIQAHANNGSSGGSSSEK